MGSKMPLSPTTPDALLLGIWSADGHAAATGAIRDWQGNTVPDALSLTGQPWTVLVQALAAAETIDAGSVIVLTNDAGLVRALSPPFRPPAPTEQRRIFFSRTEWVDVGYGGDPQHWQVLQMLGGRWGGRFRVMQVEDLPGAKQLWQCSQSNVPTT